MMTNSSTSTTLYAKRGYQSLSYAWSLIVTPAILNLITKRQLTVNRQYSAPSLSSFTLQDNPRKISIETVQISPSSEQFSSTYARSRAARPNVRS